MRHMEITSAQARNEDLAREKKHEKERRDIWARCENLLRTNSGDQRVNDEAVVLGYN